MTRKFTSFFALTASVLLVSSCFNGNNNVSINEPESQLKFAIFADIQLTNDTAINGQAVINTGATANAPLALRSHFQFIKDNNIDVVLMNGDITNQANEYYYNHYERILKEIYGEDESKYPEFVWNMGNHEWWWGTTEKESGDAVTMFKNHARIESNNLIKQSAVKYSKNNEQTVPTYYKVINGVPVLVISGENCDGTINTQLAEEIKSWLSEIKELKSVKAGGPIFVQYHYPLTTSFTHGQGNSGYSATLEELLKDTPNAVVFTGDTHFPGINERAINQVNFTTINLGSSSYSRMVDESAVLCSNYYNVDGNKMKGFVKYQEAYTPTIQVVEVKQDNTFSIDRYFTDVEGGRKVGNTWEFSPIKSKSDFTYTNERFQNKEASKALYGAEGLSWENEDKVTFGVDATTKKATVHFPDVKEYHNCEHFVIEINDQKFDVVSNYYKYSEQKDNYYYVLENINPSSTYNVKVTAYDFYDNPSLNSLTSSENNLAACVDPIDYKLSTMYTDIQVRNNFEETIENSNSSVEYYYEGISTYNAGAILGRPIYNGGEGVNELLSIGRNTCTPFLELHVKNLEEGDLTFGLSVVVKEGSQDKWFDDFSLTRKVVSGNDWQTVSWNLYDMFGISTYDEISFIAVKAKSNNASVSGYKMNFVVDGLDVLDEKPEVETIYNFAAGKDLYMPIKKVSNGETLTLDFKFDDTDDNKSISVALMQDNWKNYYGYFAINQKGNRGPYPGVSFAPLDNGFIRVTFNISELVKKDDTDTSTITEINYLYIRGSWSNVGGQMKINSKKGHVLRGEEFFAGADSNAVFNDIKVEENAHIFIDVLFTNDGHINIMLGDNWDPYFGYFELDKNSVTGKYEGVTITNLEDGYMRLDFELNKLNKYNNTNNKPTKVSRMYIRGTWSTATGYIQVNP